MLGKKIPACIQLVSFYPHGPRFTAILQGVDSLYVRAPQGLDMNMSLEAGNTGHHLISPPLPRP